MGHRRTHMHTHQGTHTSQHTRGRGRWSSDFEASLVYGLERKFQDKTEKKNSNSKIPKAGDYHINVEVTQEISNSACFTAM